jgi:hypothetical protein
MSSSPATTTSLHRVRDAPLAASGGKPYAPERCGSPIDTWMELMEAIEALCPRWPERAVSIGRDYRL